MESDNATTPKSTKSTNSNSSVQIQIIQNLNANLYCKIPRSLSLSIWWVSEMYGVATITRLLKSIGLFRRIQSLLYGSFAKESCNSKEPASGSHPIDNLASQLATKCTAFRGSDLFYMALLQKRPIIYLLISRVSSQLNALRSEDPIFFIGLFCKTDPFFTY